MIVKKYLVFVISFLIIINAESKDADNDSGPQAPKMADLRESLLYGDGNDARLNSIRLSYQARSHFLRNFEKDTTDYRYYKYYSNESAMTDYYENNNDHNYQNYYTMKESLNNIGSAFFTVMYGKFIDKNKQETVMKHLDDKLMTKIIEIIQMENDNLTITSCPDHELIKTVFYNYLSISIQSAMEILFNHQLTSDTVEKIQAYFNSTRVDDFLEDYQNKTNYEPINDCETEDADDIDESYPRIDYVVDIEENVDMIENCSEDTTSEPDKSDGSWLAGSGNFHFDISYDSHLAGKDCFFALAISNVTLKMPGHYFAYYGAWGYTGYQPIGTDKGKQKIRIVYSSFSNDAEIVNKRHCHTNINGISCYIDYAYIDYNKLYYIRSVYDDVNRIFTGYFIDPYNEKTIKIGSFQYTKEIEWQGNSANGFIETYNQRHYIASCCHLDQLNVFILCPFGDGITCNNKNVSTSEQDSNCIANDHTNMHSTVVNDLNVSVNLNSYMTTGLYIHRGWII